MNEAEINETLNNEYDSFLYGKYTGRIAIPKDILKLFKIAILSIPSYAHKIEFTKIKSIYKTPYAEITNNDLNDIIKVVLNTPPERLYPDIGFEQILERGIEMQKFVLSYNNHIEEFKKSLNSKKVSLQNLSYGVSNGMKILKSGQA